MRAVVVAAFGALAVSLAYTAHRQWGYGIFWGLVAMGLAAGAVHIGGSGVT